MALIGWNYQIAYFKHVVKYSVLISNTCCILSSFYVPPFVSKRLGLTLLALANETLIHPSKYLPKLRNSSNNKTIYRVLPYIKAGFDVFLVVCI